MLLAQMAPESIHSRGNECGDVKEHDLFRSELVEEPVKTRWV